MPWGRPASTDDYNGWKLSVSYAKILIEVDVTKLFFFFDSDVTKHLKKHIMIKDVDGRKSCQLVEYEWFPNLCPKCQQLDTIVI